MEPESRRIGNQQSLNLIDLLNHIQEQQDEQQKNFEEQQRRFKQLERQSAGNDSYILIVHANELEWIAARSEPETRFQRKDLVHGGDIEKSIRAIEFLEEQGLVDRAQNASLGFKITYGYSLGQLKTKIATAAPEEIVGILNRRGTLKKLDVWKNRFPEGRKDWIADCDEIVQTWLEGSSSSLKDEDKKKYKELCQWMSDCLDKIRKRDALEE